MPPPNSLGRTLEVAEGVTTKTEQPRPTADVFGAQLEPVGCASSSRDKSRVPQSKISVFGSRLLSSAQTVGQVRVVGADLHEPVVLGDSFTAGGRSGLELAAPGTYREVGDEGVGGLT